MQQWSRGTKMVHQNISAIPQHNHLDLSNLTLPAAKKGNETAEGQIDRKSVV